MECNIMKPFLAKALYDNLAESPDELAFRRGDIITVLEVDTEGLEGWFLCSLRNKQGICPGNRLKIVTGMQGGETSQIGQQVKRRSLDTTTVTQSNKVIIPQKVGDTFTYDKNQRTLDYDVPSPSSRAFHSSPYSTTPQSATRNSPRHTEYYDTPSKHLSRDNLAFTSTPVKRANDIDYDTPSPRNSSNQYNSFSMPNQKGQHNHLDYDMPSRNANITVSNSTNRSKRDSDRLDYDTPTSKHIVRNLYDVKRGSLSPDHPPSDRSSILSTTSNYSIQSDLLSGQATSGIGSSRSSFDITAHDYYDIPPARGLVSRDSGVDQDYDQPKHEGEDYDVPRLDDSAYESPKITNQSQMIKNSPFLHHISSRTKSDSLDYDSPRSRSVRSIDEDYDAPNSARTIRPSIDEEYDVPQTPTAYIPGDQDTLKARSKHDSKHDSRYDSKHSSIYDVPPQVTRDSILSNKSDSSDSLDGSRLSTSSLDASFEANSFSYPDLLLTCDSALDLIVRLQQDVKKSNLNLLSQVSSNWRKRDVMEARLYDVRTACTNVVSALKSFVEFAQGALSNSTKTFDRKLTKKLLSQLTSLQQSNDKINYSFSNLEHVNWNLMYLVEQKDSRKNDDLAVIISTTKGVMNDVRKICSTIQGNSSLLFRKTLLVEIKPVDNSQTIDNKPAVAQKPSRVTPEIMQLRPLPNLPANDDKDNTLTKSSKKSPPVDDISGIIDEYDYVHLSSRKNIQNIQNMKNVKNDDDLENYDEITTNAEYVKRKSSPEDVVEKLCALNALQSAGIKLERNDLQVIMFYNKQIELHADELTFAIDGFFKSIELNSPPREFVDNGKLVILAAHKLVFTGDTMHRNLMHKRVRETIMAYSNELCDFLKDSVSSTKTAALQYPSVSAMQDMVDRIVKVSQAAKKLRAYIRDASLCPNV